MRSPARPFVLGFAVGALAVFLAAGAGIVLAAGPKPRLEKVDPEQSFPGGNVKVTGQNFGEDPNAIEATVGGTKANTQDATAEQLLITIPWGLAKGKYPIELTVSGQKSNRIEVEVQDPNDKEARERKAARDAGEETTSGGPKKVKVIALDPPTSETDRGQTWVRVTGKAELPDNAAIALSLMLGTKLLESTQAKVQGGQFMAQFGPYAKQLMAGTYFVEALFSIAAQQKPIRDYFRKKYDEKERRERDMSTDRQPCRVGALGEDEAQAREIREHFASSIQRLRQHLRDLEAGFASAGRSLFRNAKGDVDEPAWEEWLGLKALKYLPEAERPKRARELRAKKDFLGANGVFADAKWREWIDPKREEVAALAKAHAAFAERFQNFRDPDAMASATRAFEEWQRLSIARSRELYLKNNLPYAPQDPDVASGASGVKLEDALNDLEKRTTADPAAAPEK